MSKPVSYTKTSISKTLREPIALIFGLLLATYFTNTENLLLVYGSLISGVLLILTIIPDIKKRYACPVCFGSGKIRCRRNCNLGFLGPEVSTYTSYIQPNDFDIDDENSDNTSITIRKLELLNWGRKGEFLQTITVNALNEVIGKIEKTIEVGTRENKVMEKVKVPLIRLQWLRNELEREPPKDVFNIEINYKPLTKGIKCDACTNGLIKCNNCFAGMKFTK